MWLCIDMYMNMYMDTRMNMCVDIYMSICIHMCTDMHIDIVQHFGIWMCVWKCAWLCVAVCTAMCGDVFLDPSKGGMYACAHVSLCTNADIHNILRANASCRL